MEYERQVLFVSRMMTAREILAFIETAIAEREQREAANA
jgi:hypothetical protein